MNMNFKSLLLGTSLSLIPQYAAAQCAETDCLKLGYTKLEKCDNGLKCPFGEYWACPKTEEKAVLGQCTGYAKNCKIGDILNSDGTCTTNKISDKTPIGVVIYISSENCGWAMADTPIAQNIEWIAEGAQGIVVEGTKDWLQAIKNYNACSNTQKMIQAGDKNAYPAAWTAYEYEPNAAPTTKTKWCLPAPGMLNSLYINLNAINNTLSKLGRKQFAGDDEHILSSVEYYVGRPWVFCTHNGANQGGIFYSRSDGRGDNQYVRPVIEF